MSEHKTSKHISKQTSKSREKKIPFCSSADGEESSRGMKSAEKEIHEMWRFGPNHPWINRAFHYKPSIFLGTTILGNIHIHPPPSPRKLTWLKWNKTTIWVDVSPEFRMVIFHDVILVVGGYDIHMFHIIFQWFLPQDANEKWLHWNISNRLGDVACIFPSYHLLG